MATVFKEPLSSISIFNGKTTPRVELIATPVAKLRFLPIKLLDEHSTIQS